MVQIIAKALAKAPETRYQTGRELADDLLALDPHRARCPRCAQSRDPDRPRRRPALVTPTLRSRLRPWPRRPTVRRCCADAGGWTRRPRRSRSRLRRPPASPAALSASAPRVGTARPRPPSRRARKSGGGAGLIIGLGLVGLLGAVVVAGAGWYFFLRKPAQVAEVTPTPGPTPAEVTHSHAPAPSPALRSTRTAPPTAAPATAPPVVHGHHGAAGLDRNPGADPPDAAAAHPEAAPVAESGGQEPAGRSSFLDVEPEGGRRRARRRRGPGQQVQQRPGIAAAAADPRRGSGRAIAVPRALAPVERPAVATIRHIINAQEAYQRKRNRYGTLSDMSQAQALFLDVPFQADVLQARGLQLRAHRRAGRLPGRGHAHVAERAPLHRRRLRDHPGRTTRRSTTSARRRSSERSDPCGSASIEASGV